MSIIANMRLGYGIAAIASAGVLMAAVEAGAQDPALIPLEDVQFFPAAEGSPVEIAVLWGDPVNGPAGVYLRIPPGFPGAAHYHDQDYHAVVVTGEHWHWAEGQEAGDPNTVGAYYFQPANEIHTDANFGDEPVVLFIFMPDGLTTTFVE